MALRELNGFSQADVAYRRAHESTSSIGPKWPPERTSSGRMKGFYTPCVIRSQDLLRGDFLNYLANCMTSQYWGLAYNRISFRAVVANDLLCEIASVCSPIVEAVIPLEGTRPNFEGTSLVYFGINHPQRKADRHVLRDDRKRVDIALSKETKTKEVMKQRAIDGGYQIEILHMPEEQKERDKVVEQIFALYTRFGRTKEDVAEMLDSPTNMIGIAIREGNIVSAGIAETAQIRVGTDTLTIVELTEAATAKEHLKKGLYTAVSAMLLEELAIKSKNRQFDGREIDLVFGECNGSALGVLVTAKYQGRTFATEVGNSFGYSNSGALPLHVPIIDPEEEADPESQAKKNNNLFPTFLSRNTLYKLYL